MKQGSYINKLKIVEDNELWTYIGYPETQYTSNFHHMGGFIRWSQKGGVTLCGSQGYINSNKSIPIIRMGDGINKGVLDGEWEVTGNLKGNTSGSIVSDINKKHEISDLSIKYSNLFDNLRPVTYKYNDGTSDRLHTGFIAQEVQEALDKSNIDSQDFAGLVVFDRGTENELWTLRYEEFIALNTSEIQKLKSRVAELERKLESLT